MHLKARCPHCKSVIEVEIPIDITPQTKEQRFNFNCGKCGENIVMSIFPYVSQEFPTSDDLIKSTIYKIDKITAPPELSVLNGRPVEWISHKLGFQGPEKKCPEPH